MTEAKHSHIGRYLAVFAALLVLTGVTVAVSSIHAGIFVAVSIALIIAITKGSLVASYFMHLIGEHKSVYWVLILTAVFFLMLLLVPLLVSISDYRVY